MTSSVFKDAHPTPRSAPGLPGKKPLHGGLLHGGESCSLLEDLFRLRETSRTYRRRPVAIPASPQRSHAACTTHEPYFPAETAKTVSLETRDRSFQLPRSRTPSTQDPPEPESSRVCPFRRRPVGRLFQGNGVLHGNPAELSPTLARQKEQTPVFGFCSLLRPADTSARSGLHRGPTSMNGTRSLRRENTLRPSETPPTGYPSRGSAFGTTSNTYSSSPPRSASGGNPCAPTGLA